MEAYIDIPLSVRTIDAQGLPGLRYGENVPIMKLLVDLQRYQEAIKKSQPELIIECGTSLGGSALFFAGFVRNVVTIDLEDARIYNEVKENENITVISGSSIDPDVIERVKRIASFQSRVMVVLDSNHYWRHVKEEIKAYGPMVTHGCYLVVEDGLIDFVPETPWPDGFPGPYKAIEECLEGNSEWRRDIEIEKMDPISMYPAGWWIKNG